MITENAIRGLATDQSFSRGDEYYHAGAVSSLVRRGDTLMADVIGSSYQPYRVTVALSEDSILSATCTCPYDWGGYCKHIVAVLLTAIREPRGVEDRPSVDALLANLDAETLRRLVGDMVAHRPDLIEWLEARVALDRHEVIGHGASTPPNHNQPRPVTLDVKAIRRLARSAMHASHTSFDYYSDSSVIAELDDILRRAREALETGDGETALTIAEILAEETIPGWEEHDDSDGEFGEWFSSLGEVVTEALLTANLAKPEREAWARKLEKWQAELDDYGIDEGFDAAIAAAEQGWEYEPLRRAMAGDFDERGAWNDEAPWFADTLTAARLNVLERQGRIEEYLNLAEAEGELERYLTMLVKAGRPQEAVDCALRNLISPAEALSLAMALHQHGHVRASLQIGEHGLGLSGEFLGALGRWVRGAAAGAGEHDLALRAATVAFEADATLDDYRAVRSLAGDEWPAIKASLLAHLAARDYAYERIDIYLDEGLIDAAIQAVDAQPYGGHAEIAKIVAVAWQSHPDWVIGQCRKQAEWIMDGAKSKYYADAIHWLEIACKAYVAAGRDAEWRSYCEGLLVKHARKYSLTPQLRQLLAG